MLSSYIDAMEVKEDGLYKPSSSERRLRLRKDYKERYKYIYVYIYTYIGIIC